MDALVQELTARLTTLVQHLHAGMAQTPPDLQPLEEQVLHALRERGGLLLGGLAQQLVPADPPRTHPCPCGATAHFQRLRPATCRTVLGPLTVTRPYYLCPACHHGVAPFDQQVGWGAGSRSAGLDELLALLGATHDSVAEAAAVLARLTLVAARSAAPGAGAGDRAAASGARRGRTPTDGSAATRVVGGGARSDPWSGGAAPVAPGVESETAPPVG